MNKQDILEALAEYEAGKPERLRELSKHLTTPATEAAEAAMAISNNELDEPGQLRYKAVFHGYISRNELIDMVLGPTFA